MNTVLAQASRISGRSAAFYLGICNCRRPATNAGLRYTVRFSEEVSGRDAGPLRFRSAPITRANLSQIGIRVDPGGVIIVEVELDGVVTDRRGTGDFDDVLPMNRKGIRCNFHRRGCVTAGRTRTALPQIGVGVGGFVPVIPFDKNTTWRRQLYRSGYNVHRAFKP